MKREIKGGKRQALFVQMSFVYYASIFLKIYVYVTFKTDTGYCLCQLMFVFICNAYTLSINARLYVLWHVISQLLERLHGMQEVLGSNHNFFIHFSMFKLLLKSSIHSLINSGSVILFQRLNFYRHFRNNQLDQP